MKNKSKENKVMKLKILSLFIFVFAITYCILLSNFFTQKHNLGVGDIAKVTIKAPREVEDKVATQALLDQAAKSVDNQYAKKNEVKDNVIGFLDEFFNKVQKEKVFAPQIDELENKIKNVKTTDSISGLSDEQYKVLIRMNSVELNNLKDVLKEIMSSLYENTSIASNDEKDVNKAKEYILARINNSSKLSSAEQKEIAFIIASSEIKPNLILDEEKTTELKKEAQKKVAPIVIKKDQIIVKEGEPVTQGQLEVLESLQLLNNSSINAYIYICLAIFVIIILMVQFWFIKLNYKSVFYSKNNLVMIFAIEILILIIARALKSYPFFIPLAFAPMLLTLLTNKYISLVISILNTIFLSAAVGFSLDITIVAFINAVLGSLLINKVQQRTDILYSSLYLSLMNFLFTISTGLLLNNNVLLVIQNAGMTLVGGVLSGVLTIGILPLLENIFGVLTTTKLLELSNPNHPLLKKLLIEAPGTYHHSILVGNLAEVATEEVGGNPVLARVAAYYHDIGKSKKPLFFKENQMNIENPHNKIPPKLSAKIIIDHVKDGVQMAKDYKIPDPIKDIIAQHHGTTLVKYFYLTLKNSADDPDSIKEEEFKYPGPIPQTKEAAIMMLADGCEAAVRSITDPTNEKIEKMIDNIIKGRLSEGQLDNCDLTLRDLDKIKKAFIKVLLGIYHERIEYPEDKWLDSSKEEKK